jgi:hypothetical protein
VQEDIIRIEKTGEIYLDEECAGRSTEDPNDLRHLGCGAKAAGRGDVHARYRPPERRGKKLTA